MEIILVTTTIGTHTRTRIYNVNGHFIEKGDMVVVPTRAGGLLIGTAASEAEFITQGMAAMLRTCLGIDKTAGAFLPILQVLSLDTLVFDHETAEPEKEVI